MSKSMHETNYYAVEQDFYMQYHVKMIIQVLLTYVPIQIVLWGFNITVYS